MLCEKMHMLFTFCAILKNEHVQYIMCDPLGEHIIHCKSAVFSQIKLKWGLFAYLQNQLLDCDD